MLSKPVRVALGVAAHLLLVLGWYLFVTLGEIPQFVMPSPGATGDVAVRRRLRLAGQHGRHRDRDLRRLPAGAGGRGWPGPGVHLVRDLEAAFRRCS
ncbi:MAG: hypothetical protein R3E68_08810 [Burkholderiaceae bacterium]